MFRQINPFNNKFFNTPIIGYYFNKNFIEFSNKKEQNKELIKKISGLKTIKKNIDFNRENINKKIEILFFNHKKTKNPAIQNNNLKSVWLKNETFFNISSPNFVIKKELLLNHFEKKRQLFFFIKEFILSLNEYNKVLIKENSSIKHKILVLNNKFYNVEKEKLNLFYNKYLSNILFNNHQQNIININNNISYELFKAILPFELKQINNKEFTSIGNNLNIFQIFYMFNYINISTWSNTNIETINLNNNALNNIFKINQLRAIKSIFTNRNSLNNNPFLNKFNKKNKNVQFILWKKNNSLFQKNNLSLKKPGNKHFFILPTNRILYNNTKTHALIKRNKNRFVNLSHILYILFKIEEKIDLYSQNEKTKPLAFELTKLYNLIHHEINRKNENNIQSSVILSNITELLKIKKQEWKSIFLNVLKTWIKENINSSNTSSYENLIKKIQRKLITTKKKHRLKKVSSKNIKSIFSYGINKKKNFFNINIKQKKFNNRLTSRKNFTNEKLVIKNNYIKYNQTKEALSLLTGKKVKIFFINALSLTKYAFNLERKLEKKEKRSPTTFLQNIDRDMINKYKYVGIYIKDLIRVCFIGMFLKKASFMAKFIAFQVAKLPRNRKETSFIRFIIKVVKTFAAEREEILGLRIKFKGRVNRWRRTKSITGERGVIPLHTIDNRIECGSAQAINRKGALGIRIWIRYKPSFSLLIKESILKYFTYSKKLKLRKKLPRLIYFTKKN